MEEEIWKDLQRGMSIRKVADKYRCSTKTVQRIKKYGRYCSTIKGDIIFTSNNVSEEELIFNTISSQTSLTYYIVGEWMYSNLDIKGRKDSFLRKCKSWESKDVRLIKNDLNIGIPHKDKLIGLYFLYQNHKLMYIGKSKDINKRLYQHSYNSHIEGLEGTYDVKIIEIGNEKDTELAERVYISMLKPPLNKEFIDELECGGFFSELMNRIPKDYNRRIEIKEKR